MPVAPPRLAGRAIRRALDAALVLGLAVCADGPTEPRRNLPPLAGADPLEFTFASAAELRIVPQANTGQRVVVFIESANPADSLALRLRNGSTLVDSAIARGGARYPREYSVWIPRSASASPLQLRLDWIRRAGNPVVVTQLVPPNGEPEHTSAFVPVGNVAVEQLDGLTDSDEFVADSSDGRRVTFWAWVDSASAPLRLRLSGANVMDPVRTRISAPVTGPTDTIAVMVGPGAFGTPSAIISRDASSPPASEPFSAGYSLRVRAIDPLPESASELLVVGDTLLERIDEFADVDSFSLPALEFDEYRFIFAQDGPSRTPLHLRVGLHALPFTLSEADSVLDLRRTQWYTRGTEPMWILVLGDSSALGERRPVNYRILYQQRARSPESVSSTLGARANVTSETLASCADADEFTITAPAGRRVRVAGLLQLRPDCRVRLLALQGQEIGQQVADVPVGADPESTPRLLLVMPPSGTQRLRIEGIDSTGQPLGRAEQIGYMLDVYAIDSTPEIGPPELATGDTLRTETIDRCSDEDVFDLTGPPGSRVVIEARPSAATTCGLAITAESEGGVVQRFGADPDAGRFGPWYMPSSGRLAVRVRSEPIGTSADRGVPYLFTSELVNTAPEQSTAAFSVGDSISETIARCGDIDEYQVSLVEGQRYVLGLERERVAHCALSVTLRGGIYNGATILVGALEALAPNLVTFEAPGSGVYTLRVESSANGNSADRGLPYRVHLWTHANEVVPAAVAIGDTSAAEPTRLYDLDLFTAQVEAGKEYAAATIGGDLLFSTYLGVGQFSTFAFAQHPGGRGLHFTALATGTLEFKVGLVTEPPFTPYQFTIHEVNLAPEAIPAALVPGDTSATEQVDHPGDVDAFTATLTAGRCFRATLLFTGAASAMVAQTELRAGTVACPAVGDGWYLVPGDGGVQLHLNFFQRFMSPTQAPSYRVLLEEQTPQ